MTMPKISPAIRKGIVARILSGRSTSAAEAKKYGQSAGTVRSWVHEARVKGIEPSPAAAPATTPDPAPQASTTPSAPVASEGIQPSATTGPADPEALARARAAAGLPPAGSPSSTAPALPGPGVDAAARAADEEDKRLVLSTYADAKKAAVELLARKAGVDTGDPLLSSAREVSPIVSTVLSANAGLIAPTIRGKVVGWPAVYGALVFDAVVTMMAIREVAVARGKVVKDKASPSPAPPSPQAA